MNDRADARPVEGGTGRALGLVALSWLVPGAGHFILGKRGKSLVFLVVILAAVIIGCQLQGNLYHVVPKQPLTLLGTLASIGAGLPYLTLRFLMHYQGDVMARGYEYGTAFLVTGGLMNWLVVLDVWDRARMPAESGKEEGE
jgi:hypothetical protein